MCEMHYYRVRRRGKTTTVQEEVGKRADMEHSGGYVLEHAPNHPLSTECMKSRVYQHRLRYYEANGEGPFPCHWCGAQIGWADLHIDHLNDVKHDNRLCNLAASCPACNQARGLSKMKATHRSRSKARLRFKGEDLCMSEWAERIGISHQSLRSRIARGWSIDRALTESRGVSGPRKALPKR